MNVIEAGLLYGLLSLDHFWVGPFLLSRPAVVGPVFGVLFGSPWEGVTLGLLAEAVWSLVPPSGPRQWDVGLPVILAISFVADSFGALGRDLLVWAVVMAVVVAVPMALLARWVDAWVVRRVRPFADWARLGIHQGSERHLWQSLLATGALWVIKSWVVFVFLQSLGNALWHALLPHVTNDLRLGLERAWGVWVGLGVAVVLHQFLSRFFQKEVKR